MPQNKYKYRNPRRVMPGRPLPDIGTQAAEEAAFRLKREREFTQYQQFFMSADPNPRSGLRGFHILKLDEDDAHSHGISFDINIIDNGTTIATPFWEIGMDYVEKDFILAFDHSAVDNAGADVIRLSRAEDDTTAGSRSTKFNFGYEVGSPAANTACFTFLAGDTLGGVNLSVSNSASGRSSITITQRDANRFGAISFDNAVRIGCDYANANAATLFIRDDLAGAHRLWMDADGDFVLGNQSTTAGRLLVPATADSTANYGVVNIGSGGFSGSAGHFASPDANGTILAINAPSGYGDSLVDVQLNGLRRFSVASSGQTLLQYRDATTTSAVAAFRLQHITTGTPAAGFGVQMQLYGQDSGTTGIEIVNFQGVETTVASGAANCAAYASISALNLGTLYERIRLHGDGRAGIAMGGANPLTNNVLFNLTKTAESAPTIRTYQKISAVADTSVAASTEVNDVYWDIGRTLTWAAGAITDQRFIRITQPTIAFASASTVTRATTFYIAGQPAAGANATLTSAYAFWIDSGIARFDGDGSFYFEFPTADATAAGAYKGRLPIIVNGTTQYLHYYDA